MNKSIEEEIITINRETAISIIIPAYNEERRIKKVISRYANELPAQEIIVVCDGEDNTRSMVNEATINYPNVYLLSFNKRLGKGGALIEGFKRAKGDIIGFVDADESITLKDFKKMLLALHNVDGVIASRRLRDSHILIEQPINRRAASKAFNILVRFLFGLEFSDTQCGAKVFKGQPIRDILNELETCGFEIDVEILWRLKEKGYKVIEYPITWKHCKGSKFKLSQSKDMLISLLRLRFQRLYWVE